MSSSGTNHPGLAPEKADHMTQDITLDTDRLPAHMRLTPPAKHRDARFTPAMGEELEFFYQRADGAMGERSAFGAMVDQALSGANRGGLVGDHGAMIARLGAVEKAKRVKAVLDELPRRARKVLQGRYEVGTAGARIAADLIPGLTHPGVAWAIEGRAKLASLSEKLRTPDKGDHNQRAAAKAVREAARAALKGDGKGTPGLNARCDEAIKKAEATYASLRAYLSPRLPKRASLEAQDAMRELDEAMGPAPAVEAPRVRYEHEPVFVRAGEVTG